MTMEPRIEPIGGPSNKLNTAPSKSNNELAMTPPLTAGQHLSPMASGPAHRRGDTSGCRIARKAPLADWTNTLCSLHSDPRTNDWVDFHTALEELCSTIMLEGRWSSDVFLLCICEQVQEFTKVVSQKTVITTDYFTVPDEDVSLEDPCSYGARDNFASSAQNSASLGRRVQAPSRHLHH